MLKHAYTLLFVVISSFTAYAQDKLVIDDRTTLLSDEVEALLEAKLTEKGIEYTTIVDFTVRCEYYFTELTKRGDEVFVTVKDCDNRTLGSKNLGSQIQSATSEEKSFLLSYNILEILAAKDKNSDALEEEIESSGGDETFQVSNHNTRYFFAPSAYNLREGELYYNTVYFLLHDIQYGLSDNFSIGIGTSVIGIPIYLTPKVSFPIR